MKKMNFEGKICGVCNKGRLHAFKEEIEKGVYVDAYKCSGGHISHSEGVERKLGAIYNAGSLERHLVRIGPPSSIAAPIPSSIVKLFKLKPKEKIFVSSQDNQIIIRPSPA